MDRTTKLLKLEDHQPQPERIKTITDDLALQGEIIMQGDQKGELICYKPSYYHTEVNLAERVSLLNQPISVDIDRVKNWLDR